MIGILVYCIPFLILGDSVLYNIGDILDGPLAWNKTLAESPFFLSSNNNDKVVSYLGGAVPRNVITPGPLNITSLSFYFFPTVFAILVNHIITLIIGFSGMYFLISKYIFKNSRNYIFPLFISLSFAFLPNKSIYGGAVFTIAPLIIYAMINLYKGELQNRSLIILFFAPYFTNLVLSTIFIFPFLVIFWILYFIKSGKIFNYVLFGISLFMLSMIIADYKFLFFHLFENEFISHRSSFLVDPLSLAEIFKQSVSGIFLEKWSHAASLHHIIVFWCIIYIIFWLFKKIHISNKILLIPLLIIFTTFSSQIMYWNGFNFIKELFPVLSEFGFYRFSYLNITWWWLLFALIINEMNKINFPIYPKYSQILLVLICITSLGYVLKNSWGYRANISLLLNKQPANFNSNTLSPYHFYSEDLFSEISTYIGKDKSSYRVGNLGLHPAVPRYNGFYTVDGYNSIYSADHKRKIKSVISGELERNSLLNSKFTNWGSRCYLFSSELYNKWNHKDKIISKYDNFSISQLRFNFRELKSLPCHYLFSTVNIDNLEIPYLKFLKSFEMNDLPYKIFVYELI